MRKYFNDIFVELFVNFVEVYNYWRLKIKLFCSKFVSTDLSYVLFIKYEMVPIDKESL